MPLKLASTTFKNLNLSNTITMKLVSRSSMIKILVKILGAQMVSRDSAISMAIHMFSLAIQEHVTIDKLALTDLFFLPHFNKPYNYITMAALTAE